MGERDREGPLLLPYSLGVVCGLSRALFPHCVPAHLARPVWPGPFVLGPGPSGPGPAWPRACLAQGPFGPGPVLSKACLALARLALACLALVRLAQGPFGPQGPIWPWPVWAGARLFPFRAQIQPRYFSHSSPATALHHLAFEIVLSE